MSYVIADILKWIRNDYASYPFRFVIEVIAWIISIGCSITMAITVPNPPLLGIYPVWIASCSLYAWGAWTRKSFGMLANFLLLITIDIIGLSRMLII